MMLAEFLKYIEDQNLIRKNDKVLLAVSGGIDSMVMAHLFISAGIKSAFAHCNFCLRGSGSDLDEELVKQYSTMHNIPFFSERFDTENFAVEKGISIQMAARDLRYKWFEKIREENDFSSVAVAHNLNDNTETILLNLTRGTGIAGLTGMKPVNGRIIRPLLFATRQRITDYCILNQIPYREDKSNAETKYSRNKIRHLVIPVLKEINPSLEISLNDTAHRLKDISDTLAFYIADLRKNISSNQGNNIIFDIKRMEAFPGKMAILFELFKPYGITASTLMDLLNVMKGRTGGQVFTSTHRLIKNREQLIVTPIMESLKTYHEIASVDELRKIPYVRSAEYVPVNAGFRIPTGKYVACLDSERVVFPLIIRNRKPGDYFHPLGMQKGKKLSDYLIDRKYSLLEKEEVLVMVSDHKVVWIIGERIDDRFKITDLSRGALRIEIARKNKEG